jgi:Fe-S-cluster containining protein
MKIRRDFGVKVDCIIDGKFCGKCCYQTEMPLTEEDIERIEKLGYRRQDFVVKVNGVYRLRNVNGKCFFLDESNRCKIYEHRPIGCRIYPVVFDVERCKAVVDDLCPMRDKISRKDIKEAEVILRELVKKLYPQLLQL